MLLPLVEMLFFGTQRVDKLRLSFLAGTIAVGVLNYLPTRLAPAALLLLSAVGFEFAFILMPEPVPDDGERLVIDGYLALVPWIAWACIWSRRAAVRDFDRLWLRFRDSWGLMWSQRVREHFNNAAQNAGWGVRLSWRGLVEEKQTPADQEKIVETLRATLQRFVDADQV
jgi:hypothetical protein